MAAKTPSSVIVDNLGSLNLIRAVFADIDNDDTWVSGIENIVDHWFNRTDDPTAGTEGVGLSNASGTVTFYTGEDNVTGTCFVLTRQG